MNAKGRVLAIAALCLALTERGTATVIGASKFTDDFSIEMQVVEDGNLTVFLTCGEDQWCGVGFTADGGSANNQFMLNSDVVVCRSSGTTATCIDSSVGGGRQLVADTQNDVVILDSSPVVNGVWSVTLTRSATTTDVSDLVVSKDLAFIWGTGALIDGVAGAAQFVKHGARSSFVLTSLEALPVIPLEGRKELTDEYLVTVSVDTVNVTVSLTCGEDKWCGFGTTLGGGDNGDQYMLNSDVVICKVVSSLVSCIDSSIGSSRSVSADAENEVEVLDWSEAEDGVWSVTWTRRLDTNNEYDQLYSVRRAFTEGKAFVWGTGDLQSNGDLVKHATKGHFFPEDLQALPTSTPETSAPETSAPDAEGGTGTVIGALKFTEDFSIEMQVVEDGNLTVFLTCGEDQWCGVGFTADGGSANNQFMLNSDVVVCRSSGTTATCIDSSVGGGRQLVADTQNDVVILDSSPVVNGVWSVTLTRSATTTDVSDLVVSKDLAFIWGTGALIDGVAGAAQFVKHGARSSFVLTSLEALPVIPLEGRKELTDEYLVTVSVDTVNVTVSLTCGEDKWCGFGTTLGGGDNGDQYMLNSDVVICKVVSSLVSCIDSSIGSSRSVSADAENEVEVLDWSEAEDGVWSVTWTRRLDTNNEYDQLYSVRRAFTEGKAFVWGTGDLQSNGDLVKHATKGHFFPEDLQALPTSTPETSAPETPTPVALVNSKVFNGDYSIKWALTDTDLVVAMTCKADRWCGLGFSETQLMLGADTIVCWYSPNPTCSDGSVVGPKSDGPTPDAVNNVVIRSSEQSGDTFTIEFSRPLVTGDSADKAVVEGSQGVVWATGLFASGTIVQHSSRAGTEIDWAPTPVSPAPETPTPVALVNSKVFNGDYSIKWALTDTDLVVAMTCKADRWCGLGFSETQLMLGADTIVCWYSPNPTCSDGSVVGPKSDGPTPDAVNNVVIRSSEQSGDTFTIEFSRPLVTGDSADKAVVEGSQGVVWATGPFVSGTIVQHSSRAGTEIDWAPTPVSPAPETPTPVALVNSKVFNGDYSIKWALTATDLLVAMTCKADRWCGLGFSETRGMLGADTIVCWYSPNPTCSDGSVGVLSKARPTPDAVNNVVIRSSEQSGDTFTIEFSRPLVTGDSADKAVVEGSQGIIWATGPFASGTIVQHSSRAGTEIDWAPTPVSPAPETPTPVALVNSKVFNGDYSIKWALTDTDLVVAMTCKADRWCGLGFSETQLMLGADTIVCWYSPNPTCSDGSVVGPKSDGPTPDAVNNVVIRSSEQSGDTFTIEFSRPLVTGDSADKAVVEGSQGIVWATGLFASGTIVQHSSRAGTEIDWTGGVEVTPGPDVQPVVTPTPTGSASLGNLQLSEGFGIEWNLTESTGDDTARRLVVRMTCTGTDYCALGLGAGMVGADVMLCFVNNGVPTCQDRKAVEKALPPLDAQQDLEVDGEGEVRDGGFIVTFSRALVTGDDSDSEITLAEPQAVIWAVGPMSGTTPGEHSTRDSGVFIDWVGTAIVPEAVVGTPIDDAILTVVDDSMSAGFEFVTASGASKRQGEALQGGDGEVVAVRVTYVCEKGRWCAMGLNDDGKMTPSDVFICWETFDGKVACSDWHCTEKDICPADALQNIVVEAFTSGPSSWSVVFSRALNTGDPQDRIMSTDTVNFIWATGDADGSSPSQQHDSFGKAVLDVETGTLAVSSGVEETSWHVITAVCLLLGLGLISGIIIAVRPSLGYFFQQSYVGAALSLCFIIAALVVIAVGDAQHYEDRVGEAAVPFGGMAQLAIALAFVLKLKMFSPVLFLMSFPQERALVWHRWIGRFGWLCVTLHFVIMCAKFGEEPQGAGVLFNAELSVSGTTDGQTSVRPVYGFVAWILYTLLVVLGLPGLRRRYYDAFVASHIVLSLGTVVFAILHLPNGWRVYVVFGAPLLLLVVDNVCRFLQKVKRCDILTVESVSTVTKLVIQPPSGTKSWGPGSYFYITIPEIGFMEAHPFSVTTHHSSGRATFYIKNMGSGTWTDRVGKASIGTKGSAAQVEGPYGKLSFDVKNHSKIILVAGGIGITPMLSTVNYMEPDQIVTLCWSVREAEVVRLLQSELFELLARFEKLRVLMYYTGKDELSLGASSSDRLAIVEGRPDFRDLLAMHADKNSAIALCGPPGLVQTASDAVKDSPLNIPVHLETFEF
ncbi:Ferric reduction oxidase 5 [Diplonema papillatum]|nr:Ferric reduction oxidase 5 [Diplonema papillatum]